MNNPEERGEQIYRDVVCAAVINQYSEMLLVRSEGYWMTPGGKKEPGETYREALVREIEEELQGTAVKSLEYYKTFKGFTPNSEEERDFHTYLTELEQEPEGFSAEIEEMEWTENPEKYSTTEITDKITQELRNEGLLE